MNYKLNQRLGLPLVTSKTIEKSIQDQGLHTPSIGMTNPFNNDAAYDKAFYGNKAPIPDLSLEMVKGAKNKSFKSIKEEGSWFVKNDFASDYSNKPLNFKFDNNSAIMKKAWSNAIDPDGGKEAIEMNERETLKEDGLDSDTIIPPRDNSMPDYQVEELKRKERQEKFAQFLKDNKTMIMVGGALLLGFGAYKILK